MKEVSWIRTDAVEEMLERQRREDEEIEEMAGIEREMIERMTKLEVTLENHQKSTSEKFELANTNLMNMSTKVDKLYEAFTQAKGAKAAVTIGLAGLGGVVGAKLSAIASYLGVKLP